MTSIMETSILDLSIKPKDLKGPKSPIQFFPQTSYPNLHTPPYEPETFKSYDISGNYYSINHHTMAPQLYSIFPRTTPQLPPKEPEFQIPLVNQNECPMKQMQNMRIPSVPKNDIPNISLHGVKKPPRPFKVYPNVPLLFSNSTPDIAYDHGSGEAYENFRIRMLESVRRANKGTNVKMRRDNKGCSPSSTMDDKDEAYREKRKKNNEAAKRSRDARKQKEDEIAIRAAFLEGENMWLKQVVRALKDENDKLRKCGVFES